MIIGGVNLFIGMCRFLVEMFLLTGEYRVADFDDSVSCFECIFILCLLLNNIVP